MKNQFSVKFKSLSATALIVYYDYVVTQLLDNKTFPTLQTFVASVKTNGESYQNLYNIAENGNETDRKARNAQRTALENAFVLLIFQAETVCAGNESLAAATGLDLLKTNIDRSRKTKSSGNVAESTSKEGQQTGSSDLSWKRAENAHAYLIQLCFGDSEVWTGEHVTGENFITLRGLNYDVRTRARIAAFTKQGERGNWSEPIKLKIS